MNPLTSPSELAVDSDELMSASAAGRLLGGVTGETVRNYCRRGLLEFELTVSGYYRPKRSSVLRLRDQIIAPSKRD